MIPPPNAEHPGQEPRNTEFAVQIAAPKQVDILFRTMIDAGDKSCWELEDGELYEKMRFSPVDDLVGIRSMLSVHSL
jgi:hypothetical protein